MRKLAAFILTTIAFVWMVWAITLSGFTVFAYLGGPSEWDAHLAYAMSAIGLIPIVGGILASFMSWAVQGWGFFHAAFNFIGFMIPALVAGALMQWEEKKRLDKLSPGERMVERLKAKIDRDRR